MIFLQYYDVFNVQVVCQWHGHASSYHFRRWLPSADN